VSAPETGGSAQLRVTEVAGVRLRWAERGADTPVVLIHGIPTGPRLWRHVLPRLEGARALQPSTPLMAAAPVGMMLHVVLSIIYGLIFAGLVAAVPALRSTAAVIVGASLFGLLLWLINFYVIAPPAGWAWFPTQANPVQQFISHVFAFGTVLGVYLDRALASRRASVPSPATA
jgi:pimeloyl-ACP methyl ester carboxylesterase